MISFDPNGGCCWPRPVQESLLRAALLPRPAAVEALQRWRKDAGDLRELDSGSRRLLPLVYKNVPPEDIDDDLLDACRDAYKNCFCENEVRLHITASLLNAFRDADIATMVLKGSALIPLFYADSGLRPMADCDVLVHVDDVYRAISLLQERGWQSVHENPEKRVLMSHSTPFEDGNGQQLDLHWHVMWECWHADDDDDFWKNSVLIKINDAPTRALDPTDQLLHVCWHGARWDAVPPIRWISDSMLILKTSLAEIDWTRLVEQARKRHLSLPLYDCLHYLRAAFDAPIPPSVPEMLANVPVFMNERLAYRIATNPLRLRTTAEILRALSYDLIWIVTSTRFLDWPVAIARFVQAKWQINRLWQVPFVLSARGWRRLGNVASSHGK